MGKGEDTNMKKTIALIGIGYWGKKIAKYTDKYFNVKHIADSKFNLNSIWNDSTIDGVIIATPIDTHHDLTILAIGAGKHVLVEKPVALTVDAANDITIASSKYKKDVLVEYTQTFSDSVSQLPRKLSKIGDICHIEMSTKHLGRFTGHDVFWLLASHHLSILGTIYPLEKYRSYKNEYVNHSGYGMTSTGEILLRSGDVKLPTVTIQVSLDYPGKEMKATFYGTEGTLHYQPMEKYSLVTETYHRARGNSPEDITIDSWHYRCDEKNNLNNAMIAFDDMMRGTPTSNLSMAIEVTRLIEEAEKL